MNDLLVKIVEPLLAWYGRRARILPWRENPEPYRVWVSEVMLQQTRVEAVKPYFTRFLAELPTPAALAAAPEAQILKLWEGLGYYNRVRNLQKGAQEVMTRFDGVVPSEFDELLTLPGVGRYTAGAIASIAYGRPVAAVDGNVLRVTARLLYLTEDVQSPRVRRNVEEALCAVLPEGRAGDFNQALMELGALVCVPNGAPHCADCPLAELCRAHALGAEESLPVRSGKKPRRTEPRTVFLLTSGGRLALRRRPERGLLAGLWELPSVSGRLEEEEAKQTLAGWGVPVAGLHRLADARHIFTHLTWEMCAWAGETPSETSEFVWASAEELARDYTLPSAFKAYFAEIAKRIS